MRSSFDLITGEYLPAVEFVFGLARVLDDEERSIFELASKEGGESTLDDELFQHFLVDSEFRIRMASKRAKGIGALGLYVAFRSVDDSRWPQRTMDIADLARRILESELDRDLTLVDRDLFLTWLNSLSAHIEAARPVHPRDQWLPKGKDGIRMREIRMLAREYRSTRDMRVLPALARIVAADSSSKELAEVAYQAMFEVAGEPSSTWPVLLDANSAFRFPDDVNWDFVKTFLK